MKVLITGAGGQLGYDLMRVFKPLHKVCALSRAQLDVANENEVMNTVWRERPDIVLHAAAYTNVDGAEIETELAYEVNALGSLYAAKACEQLGAKFVYVSTDYVFDGDKGFPYEEGDAANPISIYGRSKLLGEQFARSFCSKTFIVRTSWLYGTKGVNFVSKILQKAQSGGPLSIVNDQYGSPTYCLDLALFIRELIDTERYGIYHASNEGSCSRYEFAEEILSSLRMQHTSLLPVSSEMFPLPAPRPVNSALAHKAILANGFSPIRDWKSALRFYLKYDHVFQSSLGRRV